MPWPSSIIGWISIIIFRADYLSSLITLQIAPDTFGEFQHLNLLKPFLQSRIIRIKLFPHIDPGLGEVEFSLRQVQIDIGFDYGNQLIVMETFSREQRFEQMLCFIEFAVVNMNSSHVHDADDIIRMLFVN